MRLFLLMGGLLMASGGEVCGQSAAPENGDPAFTAVTVSSLRQLQQMAEGLGEGGLDFLERLNRRDREHMAAGTVLAVPENGSRWRDYSPFPLQIQEIAVVPKLILVSLESQLFGAFESGRLVRWGPTSTGTREQATPAHIYFTNFKERNKRSTVNRNWVMDWYFNLHTGMGVAFHKFAMPGYPASYGCIRLLESDARWIHQWAEEWIDLGEDQKPEAFGTPVIVFGRYDYDSSPPWTGLERNPDAGNVPEEEILNAWKRYSWFILHRQEARTDFMSSE